MNPKLILLSSCVLYTYGASIDPNVYADFIIKKGFNQDLRIKASNDKTSPAAAAALAYIKNVFNDDLCGIPAQVYVENILNGQSKEKASAAASKFYIEAYNRGVKQLIMPSEKLLLLEALDKFPETDETSACAKATKA